MPTVMMQEIPMEHGLLLAAVLFALGLIGVLTRRNMVFVLMSLEIMLNAAALAFVVAGARWGQTEGSALGIPDRLGSQQLQPLALPVNAGAHAMSLAHWTWERVWSHHR